MSSLTAIEYGELVNKSREDNEKNQMDKDNNEGSDSTKKVKFFGRKRYE